MQPKIPQVQTLLQRPHPLRRLALAIHSVLLVRDDILRQSFHPYRFVVLEALSATGLRAIRYAKELPLVK